MKTLLLTTILLLSLFTLHAGVAQVQMNQFTTNTPSQLSGVSIIAGSGLSDVMASQLYAGYDLPVPPYSIPFIDAIGGVQPGYPISVLVTNGGTVGTLTITTPIFVNGIDASNLSTSAGNAGKLLTVSSSGGIAYSSFNTNTSVIGPFVLNGTTNTLSFTNASTTSDFTMINDPNGFGAVDIQIGTSAGAYATNGSFAFLGQASGAPSFSVLANVTGATSVGIGSGAVVAGDGSVGILGSVDVNANGSVSIGGTAFGTGSVVIGVGSTYGANSLTIGSGNALGDYCVEISGCRLVKSNGIPGSVQLDADTGVWVRNLTMHSNTWSLFGATNGMQNFDNRLTISNHTPVMVFLSNGVPFVNFLTPPDGGILP
jgi:hypothetical protein